MTNLVDAMGGEFDADKVEPFAGYEVLPAGWYAAEIDEAEIKQASTGGEYLAMRYALTDPKFMGRKVWDNLNIVNKSQKAQEIARAKLSLICRSVGILKPKDSHELLGKAIEIKLDVEDSERGPKNKVGSYRLSDTTESAPAQEAAPTATTTDPKPGPAHPWKQPKKA